MKELRAIADMHHAICFWEFKKNAEGSGIETAMTKWSGINIIRNLFQLHSWIIQLQNLILDSQRIQLYFITAFSVPADMFSNDLKSCDFGIGSTRRRNAMIYLKYLEDDLKEFSNNKTEFDMWHRK